MFAEHAEILRMYDQRLAEQAKLLDQAIAMSRPVKVGEVNAADQPEKKGPRIIGNVQVAPPRHVVDSVSGIASPESAAESPRWRAVRKDRPRRLKDRNRSDTEAAGNSVTPGGGNKERNPRQVKLRPSNAVVVIKTKENCKAPYSEILKLARQRVNIKELGSEN